MESLNVASNEAHQRANELELTTIDLNRLKDESDTIFNSVDHGLCLLEAIDPREGFKDIRKLFKVAVLSKDDESTAAEV